MGVGAGGGGGAPDYSPVGQGLQSRVQVAGVAQVLQTCQPCTQP